MATRTSAICWRTHTCKPYKDLQRPSVQDDTKCTSHTHLLMFLKDLKDSVLVVLDEHKQVSMTQRLMDDNQIKLFHQFMSPSD